MSSNTVNRPTDPKLRDQNVETKLQIYGILTAFGNGKVPTNQQIDVAMNTALQWQALSNPPKTLSPEGQRLVADLRNVIEQAKVLVLSKNDGNLIQDFIWQTRHIGQDGVGSVKRPVGGSTADQHASDAAESLRTLARLVITNGQFRKLLNDATILLRDMAGDAAQKGANKVNPSEDQLNQIDEAEQEHTWHSTPDMSRDNLKQQAQSRTPGGQGTTQNTAQTQQDLSSPRDQASGNLDERQKEKLREQRERAVQYLDEKVPEERRKQVINRLKKMVVECQDHSEYQQAIDALLRLAEEYHGHAKNVTQQSGEVVQSGRDQSSAQLAEHDLKTILERFANGTSFDSLIDSIDQIYRDADNDPELKNWFKELDTFIRKCLKEQGFILEDKATEEYNRLYEKGDYLLRDKYKDHTDRVVDELKYLSDQFNNDPLNNAFARSIEKLFKDLSQDQSGRNAAWKPHLVKDLTRVIIPGFFRNVGYIPVPRIEYSDPMVDAIVENLILEGDNILPNTLDFSTDNHWHWARSAANEESHSKNKAELSITGIQMDIRDVAYYINKKQGFPSITDKGVMDIFFGGSGISLKVAMQTADKNDKEHFFRINNVETDIQGMKIKIQQSNHKLLFNLVKPLLLRVMRPIVQRVLEKQVRDNVQKFDAMCFEAKKEGERAAESARRSENPEDVKSIYQYYYNAFQNQLSKGQRKKEEVVSNKQANIATTQHESIFKNISLPSGFSTQATKYNNMAREGEKWQSPIFSIGSASESQRIKPVEVTGMTRNRNHGSSRGTGLDSTLPNNSSTMQNNNAALQNNSLPLQSNTSTLQSNNPTLQRNDPALQSNSSALQGNDSSIHTKNYLFTSES